MVKVLHITPHLGGGVGRVLLSYLVRVWGGADFSHKVLCLDYANPTALKTARQTGFPLMENMAWNPGGIKETIKESDLVLIHWWNHPLLYAFLVREALPPARVIMWSHISGFYPPYVFTGALLAYPDLFVFTTPMSLETKEVPASGASRDTSRVIWSTAGTNHVESVESRKHDGFRVGYIGTVDYCRLHRDFLKMSTKVRIPDVHFVVCGGPYEKEMEEEARGLGMNQRFTFVGHTDRITDYLSEFDLFGYPLSPTHYGTCDQALSESMAAGVPPVVLSNSMERYMVENRVTGIVAETADEYASAIEELYRKPELRHALSRNAREKARNRFSIDRMITEWNDTFFQALALPKKVKKWPGTHSGINVSPAEIFVESLGDYGSEFQRSLSARSKKEEENADEAIRCLAESSYNWLSKTRGTAHHYHSFFPDDPFLKRWSTIMNCTERGG